MRTTKFFLNLLITVASLLVFMIGCTENNPSAITDDTDPVVETRFAIVKTNTLNYTVEYAANKDTFYVEQTIFVRLMDKLSLAPFADSVQWHVGNIPISSGPDLATGELKFLVPGQKEVEAFIYLNNGTIDKAFDTCFLIVHDTTIIPTPADSIFMLVSASNKGDGTWDYVIGAYKPLADQGSAQDGPGYQGNVTVGGWGTVYTLVNTNPSNRLYLFLVNIKDKTRGEVQLNHSHLGNTVTAPYTQEESKDNKYYVAPPKDIFCFFAYKGVLHDTIPSDTTEDFQFPYQYGDEDTADWVCGFIENTGKDTITVVMNMKHTTMTTGDSYLLNMTNDPNNPVENLMTEVDTLDNVLYLKMAVADMHQDLGLVWTAKRNNVKIDPTALAKSKYYSQTKEALWGIWTVDERGVLHFVPGESVL